MNSGPGDLAAIHPPPVSPPSSLLALGQRGAEPDEMSPCPLTCHCRTESHPLQETVGLGNEVKQSELYLPMNTGGSKTLD